MGVIKRNSFTSTTISFLGAGLGFLCTIWLFPNFLTPDQNGLTVVLLSVAMIYQSFAHLGSINSLNHFYFRVHKDKRRNGALVGYAFSVCTGGFVIIAVLILTFKQKTIEMFGSKSPLFIDYFNWIFFISFFLLLYSILESYARSLFKLMVPTFIKEVLIRVLNIIAILLFGYDLISFPVFIASFAASYFIAFFLMFAFLKFRKKLPINFNFAALTKKEYSEITKYSFSNILNGTIWVLATRIDILMITFYLGLTQPAVFNIAVALVTLIQIPLRSMQQVAVPVITRSWKENDMTELKNFYHQSALNLLLIGSFLFLLLVANLAAVFHFLPSVYHEAKPLIIILGISKVIDMATGVNTEIIMFSKKYYVLTIIIAIIMIITVTANFILIPVYGITGAAYSSFIAVAVFNLLKFLWVKNEHGFQMTSLKYFIVLLLAAVTFCTVYFIPDYNRVIPNSMMKSSIVLVMFLFPVLFFKLSPELNSVLGHLQKRFLKLLKGKI